jgi:hypothetical protein
MSELRQILTNGLRLYYSILKLHRRVLPPQMRAIGDLYVRQEFKHHHEDPQLEFYLKFYVKWQDYHRQLTEQGVLQSARHMEEREEKMLTAEQREALRLLKEGIQKAQ